MVRHERTVRVAGVVKGEGALDDVNPKVGSDLCGRLLGPNGGEER